MRKPGKDIKIKNLQRDSQIMHNSMIYAKKWIINLLL
jgi:hypothetical protein